MRRYTTVTHDLGIGCRMLKYILKISVITKSKCYEYIFQITKMYLTGYGCFIYGVGVCIGTNI